MSTPAPPTPRHRAPHPTTAAALSGTTWRRVRQLLTIGVFVATTAAGVTIGLNGAAVSPVTPAAPALAAGPAASASIPTTGTGPAPGAIEPPPTDIGPTARHGHGPHR